MFPLIVLLAPAAAALYTTPSPKTIGPSENRTCLETQYSCHDDRCIPKTWVCDNERDCIDGDDEESCSETKCMFNQFKCDSGSCIPDTWVCDGQADCTNQADEANCTKTCGPDKFVCETNNLCIQKVWVCDGDNDCGDNSDEENCEKSKCRDDEFACDQNTCISLHWRCDGDFDCRDKSDETDCMEKHVWQQVCRVNEYLCEDRLTCIPSSWLCDGDPDCAGSDDEKLEACRVYHCRDDQFMCRDHTCISGNLYCNGNHDCADKSDEDNCTVPVKSCEHNEFDCGGNTCIAMSKVCDGLPDCPDGEDEPARRCHVNECLISNGGCSHICVDTPTGYYCSCNSGFKLATNYTCEDINECENPGACSHKCINEFGSHKCECFDGYTKDPYDRTKCKPTVGHTHLLFTKKHDIRKLSMDLHQEMSLLVNDTKHSAALNFMFKTGMIYWSDLHEHKIYKAPISDHTRSVFMSEDIVTCDGIAVDWIYDHIYWTDTGKDSIEVAKIDGTMRKTLFSTSLEEPRAIVVNPLDGWMYWSDWGEEARIERAGMDGSHRQVIVSYDIKWPNGLALDLVRQKLYWIDAKLHSISSVNYDGSGRSVILKSADIFHHPFSISVFEDYMYWTDWEKNSIFRANKFNGQNVTAVTGDRKVLNVMVVHAYHPYLQPNGTNYCTHSEKKCSHFCFPSPQINERAPKISCSCPDGHFLANDGLSCTPEGPATPHPNSGLHLLKSLSAQTSNPVSSGAVATIVVVSVLVFLVFASTVAFIIYRNYVRKSTTSINFDNPVYRKTTEDKILLMQPYPQSSYIEDGTDDMQEPLTHSTNQYI